LNICRSNCGQSLQSMPLDSYDLIAHREKLCPACGNSQPKLQLDSRYLASPFDPRIVSARMTLETGTLSAMTPHEKRKWRFLPSNQKYNNVPYAKEGLISDQAVLTVEAQNPIRLVITRQSPEPSESPLKLTLRSGAHVEVGNMPMDDIVNLKTPVPGETVDHHFGLFYTMFERPLPTDPPVPQLATEQDWPTWTGGGPRHNCPPLADEQQPAP
jgi:hypothetical protein